MSIYKPDSYVGFYAAAKQMNPDAKLVWRSYEKHLVDKVDAIVELAHGERDFVTSDADWKIVEELLKFFAREWPYEFEPFRKSVFDIRRTRRNGGYSESREIKYVGAIPPRLMKMVKAIFPAQQWDKKFVNKFVKRFPLFKIGGEGN